MLTCPTCKRPQLFQDIAAATIPTSEDEAMSLATLRSRVFTDGKSRTKITVFKMLERAERVLKTRGRALRRKYIRHGRSYEVYLWHEPVTPRGKR